MITAKEAKLMTDIENRNAKIASVETDIFNAIKFGRYETEFESYEIDGTVKAVLEQSGFKVTKQDDVWWISWEDA